MKWNRAGSSARAAWPLVTGGALLLLLAVGCKSSESWPAEGRFGKGGGGMAAIAVTNSNSLQLHAGDSLRISFPGAPNLDAQTTIRLDGKISLPSIGEIPAAGLTPTQLEQKLVEVAGPQLVVKEVSVTVISSAFEIYVTGAVGRSGKLVSDRVMTPLEAVVEAGVDFQRANLKSVKVIRRDEGGQTHNIVLNLQRDFKGKPTTPFVLKPYDIIYVPERFTWF